MDISNFTIEKLKSLAYDALTELEFIQKNLNIINNEIAKKKEIERTTPPERVESKEENTKCSAEPEKAKEVKPTNKK